MILHVLRDCACCIMMSKLSGNRCIHIFLRPPDPYYAGVTGNLFFDDRWLWLHVVLRSLYWNYLSIVLLFRAHRVIKASLSKLLYLLVDIKFWWGKGEICVGINEVRVWRLLLRDIIHSLLTRVVGENSNFSWLTTLNRILGWSTLLLFWDLNNFTRWYVVRIRQDSLNGRKKLLI